MAGCGAVVFSPINSLPVRAEGALGHGIHSSYCLWAMGDCGLPQLWMGTRIIRWESAGDRRFNLTAET